MKKYLALLLAGASLMSHGFLAQAENNDTVVARIPFAFTVGSKTFPAGTYSVGPAFDDRRALLIRGEHGGGFVLPIEFDGSQLRGARLDFDLVADTHFLSGVSTPQGSYKVETLHFLKVASRGQESAGSVTSGSK
jgi:hypothetical protein